jgi:hypothetical protein
MLYRHHTAVFIIFKPELLPAEDSDWTSVGRWRRLPFQGVCHIAEAIVQLLLGALVGNGSTVVHGALGRECEKLVRSSRFFFEIRKSTH